MKAESYKKSAFALQYAIEDTDWTIPKYISDGLAWLAGGVVTPPATPVPPEVALASEEATEVPADG